jgi:hypothetical protein
MTIRSRRDMGMVVFALVLMYTDWNLLCYLR